MQPNVIAVRLRGAAPSSTVLENLAGNTPQSAYIAATLNASLKSQLAGSLNSSGFSTLAALLDSTPAVNLAAVKDMPLRTFVTSLVEPRIQNDPARQQIEAELATLSSTTTVSELLRMNTPLAQHPLFVGEVNKLGLDSLLATSPVGANEQLRESFILLYTQHSGPIQDFWAQLRTMPVFNAPGVVTQLQRTMQLGLLTQNNVPLVAVLQQTLQAQGTLRDLTRLSTQQWTQFVAAHPESIPASIPGKTPQERTANYVSGIQATLQHAFPTAYVALGVARAPALDLPAAQAVLALNPTLDPRQPLPAKLNWGNLSAADQTRARAAMEGLRQELNTYPGFNYKAALAAAQGGQRTGNSLRQQVAQFFANAPDFDFRHTNIDAYLAKNSATAFQGISDRVGVADQLKRYQRVFALTPSYDTMSVLLGEGYDSAYRIASTGRDAFVAQMRPKLGSTAQASALYEVAQQTHARVLALYTHMYQLANDVTPAVLAQLASLSGSGSTTNSGVSNNGAGGSTTPSVDVLPNWSTLFGGVDFCDCEDCRSVYSPAAYFVDLLHFLNPKTGVNPLSALRLRRPDLEYIPLTCENTNTPLPYVDLVNEVLETYIAHLQKLPNNSPAFPQYPTYSNDTPADATPDQLNINPDYSADAQQAATVAYTALANAFYPMTLPFDRSAETVRTYLEFLGSSRFEVMSTFQANAGAPSAAPSDLAIACEYLKIGAREHTILTGTDFTGAVVNPALGQTRDFYGYSADTVSFTNPQTGVSAPTAWNTCLTFVPEFLSRTGIVYTDLIELVKTRFLNPNLVPNPAQSIKLNTAGDGCELVNITITNLDIPTLGKMHRFIRLWRKLGWQVSELDQAIAALGASDITDMLLTQLAAVKRLQNDLKLPVPVLLSFWANINTFIYDTTRDDSLYTARFQNKAVLSPVDPAFALKADRSDIAAAAQLADHTATILAALHIRSADLTVLTTADPVTGAAPEVPDPNLTLANLSHLFRYAVLAKALNISVNDLLALKALAGLDPFGSTNQTVQFVKKVRKVSASGFSVAQLNYLYRHVIDLVGFVTPRQADVALLLQTLRNGLVKIIASTTLVPDPKGDLTRKSLGALLGDDLAGQALGLLNGTATYTAPLAVMPAITIPPAYVHLLTYDSAGKVLRYTGAMSTTDLTALVNLAGPGPYQAAINTIYQKPRDFITANFAAFLTPADAITNLIESAPPALEDRCAYVLKALLPYLRDTESRILVRQTVSNALHLDTATADLLLDTLIPSRIDPTHLVAMDDLLALGTGGLAAGFGSNPTGQTVSRVDATIDFDWTGAPDPGITTPAFTARWSGKVLAQYSETYTFFAKMDNGVRVTVDGQTIIDSWMNQPLTEHTGKPVDLKAGQWYDITVDYSHQSGGDANAHLSWQSASTPKQIVPQSQLYPTSSVQIYLLLHKAALIINTFKISTAELTYLSSHSADFGGFSLKQLPLHFRASGAALFAQWEQLYDLFTLRNTLPQADVTLLDVFAVAAVATPSTQPLQPTATLFARVLAATGWDPVDLGTLATNFALTVGDLRNATRLVPLQACLALGRRLGVSAKLLWAWAQNAPDPIQAQDVKNALKANYDDSQWPTVAKPLSDTMREKQKEALIAYLLPVLGLSDSDQLFEYFLIDVDMSPCMMTSRIKQAISSVQLFIQRCLLNLENNYPQNDPRNVPPGAIGAQQWQWMKHYRVWEANRMVFLYPENWILPELRDNKTPIFKELETQLLQADVTADTAEQAFLDYLEKLDSVAHLEISGMYWEYETDSDTGAVRDILHVVGRTMGLPHLYYYRTLTNNTTWSAWEKINLDIEGDHLVPVVWNRRLHLFWPIFHDKAASGQIPAQNSASEPSKYWEIKIAWSEYKGNKWTPKHVSKDDQVVTFTFTGTTLKREDLIFMPVFDPPDGPEPDLIIRIVQNELSNGGIGEFRFTGTHGGIVIQGLTDPKTFMYNFITPENSEPKYQAFAEYSVQGGLTLEAGDFGDLSNADPYDGSLTLTPLPVLSKTPSKYRLLYSHQYEQYDLQTPFFYQDDQRTYFAQPVLEPIIWILENPDYVYPTYNMIDNAGASKQIVGLLNGGGIRAPQIYEANPTLLGSHTVLGNPGVLTPLAPARLAQQPFGFAPNRLGNNGPQALITAPGGQGGPLPYIAQPVNQMMSPGGQAGRAVVGNITTAARDQTVATVGGIRDVGIITLLPSPTWASVHSPYSDLGWYWQTFYTTDLSFATYFHPHTCELIKALNWSGVPGLLTLCNQKLDDSGQPCPPTPVTDAQTIFKATYAPTSNVVMPYPREDVDFSYSGAYSQYNWEIFFHVPMLIAARLTQNRQFEEAQKWLHYVFNPTTNSNDPSQQRYWNVLPFYNNANGQHMQITTLLETLDYTGSDPTILAMQAEVNKEIAAWKETPFDPHLIARMRLSAYQKYVVMTYLDNLIAWGDYLFSQDTIETINEATQLYILAWHILGPRPQDIPPSGTVATETYHDLAPKLDSFSNAAVQLENYFPFTSQSLPPSSGSGNGPGIVQVLDVGQTLYFCIPRNDKLLKYWDTVADRLYKIRNCMNIEGVVRQLPLFEPPIDPGLLVRAAALGVDLGSALSDINAATPYYRFTYMVQKAAELIADVKALGAALLAALEKKDAEALAALRASQETDLLKAVRNVKEQQLNEAQTALAGLQKSRDVTQIRLDFYTSIAQRNPQENEQISQLGTADTFQEASQVAEALVAVLHLIPDFNAGASGWAASPVVTAGYGGANVGNAAEAAAKVLGFLSSIHSHKANMAQILGAWARRSDDWDLQKRLAAKELEQIDQQIAAAQIRIQIAQLELDNQDKQIDNASAIEDFLRNKFTSTDLYDWMVTQISASYFQSYQLAYDIAKRAEMAFRFERGVADTSYIQFGYWDSLKRGLQAGERLHLDLKRMEMAYIDQNKREYEITKQISLAVLDPLALVSLKELGACVIELPEAYFDADYPGHYMRRIKSVSLTVPCVAGPYTSINGTLTLLASKIRVDSNAAPQYPEQDDDQRFVTSFNATQAIATSHAQSDSGMFELNFRDERYLPFEGSGAASRWRLELPLDCNAFDFNTITDVILELRYTARDGGVALRNAARQAATLPVPAAQPPVTALTPFPTQQPNLTRLFSAKHEFAGAWIQFLTPTDPATATLALDFSQARFGFQLRGKTLKITQVDLYMLLDDALPRPISPAIPAMPVTLTAASSATYAGSLTSSSPIMNGIPVATIQTGAGETIGAWQLSLARSAIPSGLAAPPAAAPYRLNPATVVDVLIVCHISAS